MSDMLRKIQSLERQIRELQRVVSEKSDLGLARMPVASANSREEVLTCISNGTFDRYEVVMVLYNSTEQLLPIAKKYDYSEARQKHHVIGVAVSVSQQTGDAVKVQIGGIATVRVAPYTGTYGDSSKVGARTGMFMRASITTAGTAQVLTKYDAHEKHFMCVQDQCLTDEVALVHILGRIQEYTGPFKGSISTDQTSIVIGYDRGYALSSTQWVYDGNDHITWLGFENIILTLSSAESVVISNDNTYVYYLIEKTSGPALTVTLKASTTYPQNIYADAETPGRQVVVLGKAKYDAVHGGVYAWTQYHYGHIHVNDNGNVFTVDVVQYGGVEGNLTTQCSFTYDVYDLSGNQIGANLPVEWARPAVGKFVAGTKGLAYVTHEGVLKLIKVDEVESTNACSGA